MLALLVWSFKLFSFTQGSLNFHLQCTFRRGETVVKISNTSTTTQVKSRGVDKPILKRWNYVPVSTITKGTFTYYSHGRRLRRLCEFTYYVGDIPRNTSFFSKKFGSDRSKYHLHLDGVEIDVLFIRRPCMYRACW